MEMMKTPFAVTDPAIMAAAQKEKSVVETRYQMAIYAPRNVEQCRAAILETCKRPGFADDALWTKKVWDSSKRREVDIHGLNIRFAELALMLWRNIASDTRVVYEDDTKTRYQVTVTDYETNGTFAKEFQVSKTVERKKKGAKNREIVSQRKNNYGDDLYIVVATEQEMIDKTSAIESKVIRNQVLRLLPVDIKEDAKNCILNTITAGMTDNPDAAKVKLLDAFQALGIMPEEIERFLGHGVNIIAPKELTDLRVAYKTVKSGEQSWHDICPVDEKPEPVIDKTPKVEKLKKLKKAKKQPARKMKKPGPNLEKFSLRLDDGSFINVKIEKGILGHELVSELESTCNNAPADLCRYINDGVFETVADIKSALDMISGKADGG